jgi:hypothetical protein
LAYFAFKKTVSLNFLRGGKSRGNYFAMQVPDKKYFNFIKILVAERVTRQF